MTISELSTQELVNIINGEAVAALKNDSADFGANEAIEELFRREADRAEYVRLSNLKKTSWSKFYICGKVVDGVITSRFKESDVTKAKSYMRA